MGLVRKGIQVRQEVIPHVEGLAERDLVLLATPQEPASQP